MKTALITLFATLPLIAAPAGQEGYEPLPVPEAELRPHVKIKHTFAPGEVPEALQGIIPDGEDSAWIEFERHGCSQVAPLCRTNGGGLTTSLYAHAGESYTVRHSGRELGTVCVVACIDKKKNDLELVWFTPEDAPIPGGDENNFFVLTEVGGYQVAIRILPDKDDERFTHIIHIDKVPKNWYRIGLAGGVTSFLGEYSPRYAAIKPTGKEYHYNAFLYNAEKRPIVRIPFRTNTWEPSKPVQE